jgi:phosphosulfolactate phosphohydrolase-like enzyme
MMVSRGLRHEVEFACKIDSLPVVAALDEGRVRLLG